MPQMVSSRSSSVPQRVERPSSWVPQPKKLEMKAMVRPQEWQEEEVCRYLQDTFQAPQDLVALAREQAITGKVLQLGLFCGSLEISEAQPQ